jgi:hypothetical protein
MLMIKGKGRSKSTYYCQESKKKKLMLDLNDAWHSPTGQGCRTAKAARRRSRGATGKLNLTAVRLRSFVLTVADNPYFRPHN